jgi:hypothetical protein
MRRGISSLLLAQAQHFFQLSVLLHELAKRVGAQSTEGLVFFLHLLSFGVCCETVRALLKSLLGQP